MIRRPPRSPLFPYTTPFRSASTSQLMSVAIRPLAEVLTELPAVGPESPATAGAPFELYDRESVSPFPSARWTILLERSEEHTSELQSRQYLVCRLLLEKKEN